MVSRRPIRAWFLATLFFAAPAACLFTGEVPEGPCANGNDALCDDANPCTVDTCGPEGFCAHEPDDSLVPDDGNPCTEDVCVSGAEQHTNLPPNTKCGLDDMLVCEDGKCKCTSPAECGTDQDCLKYTCENQACKTVNVPEGTFVDAAGDADCRQNACDGAGKVANVPDLMDYPPDPTPGDCQRKGCSADGKVVNVAEPSDVPGGDTAGDCKKKTCAANGTVMDVPDLTDVPSDATSGDCKVPTCDPNGNVIDIDAPDDAPPDDNNPCTTEGCNGGTPINYTPVANGTPCGAAASCGSTGLEFAQTTAETCQSGVCQTAMTTSCGLYTCNGDACYLTCTTNAQCAGGAYCSGNLCKTQGGLGLGCTQDAECASNHCADGVCCNVTCNGLCQTCTLPGQIGVCGSIPSGTDPDSECAGADVCDGAGACKKPIAAGCGNNGDCLSGHCEDGVCCDVACGGDCKACNLSGSVGTCENVPAGQTAGACSGASTCNGLGSCKKANGQGCGGNSECASNFCVGDAGGGPKVCCDTSCNGLCKSCFGSKTGGSDGTCGFISDKTDPDDECGGAGCNNGNGSGCCDGSGACY